VFETYAASCGRGTDNALTLTTHAIVGGAIASLMPAHPWLGLSLAFASHFLLDALPHWDYPIRSSSINPDIAARMKYDGALIADLLTIGFDAALGIVVAVALFKCANADELSSSSGWCVRWDLSGCLAIRLHAFSTPTADVHPAIPRMDSYNP
jgi:hypothetical protein